MRGSAGDRLLALGLLTLAAMLLAGFAAFPFLRQAQRSQELEESHVLLAGLEAQIARRALAPGAAASDPARLMLGGETTGMAGAGLQKLINDVVTHSDGRASSYQLLPAEEQGALSRLSLNLRVSIHVDGLRGMLHRIESGLPLLIIDDIAIRVPRAPADMRPDASAPLDVTLQVSGFAPKTQAKRP